MCQVHLIYSDPISRIIHFSRKPYFISLKNRVRNQDLDTECVHFYRDVVLVDSLKRTKLGNICMYPNPRIHTYL